MTRDRRGTPVYLQVAGQPSERMGWTSGRGDLPSLLRQFATYVERGGDNRAPTTASPEAAVPPPPEPEREEDR